MFSFFHEDNTQHLFITYPWVILFHFQIFCLTSCTLQVLIHPEMEIISRLLVKVGLETHHGLLSELIFQMLALFCYPSYQLLLKHDRHDGKRVKQIEFPAKQESHTSLVTFMASFVSYLLSPPVWLVGCSCSCKNYNFWLTRAIPVLSGCSPGARLNFISRTVLPQIS